MLFSCHDLTVAYGSQTVLENFTLCLPKGQVRALIGPNGSGKSTALQAMAGLLPLTKGTALLDDQMISGMKRWQIARQLAFLPQNPLAPEDMSVKQLVRQGRYAHTGLFRRYQHQDEEAVQWALERTGLIALAERSMRELSGGERQRAWIAASIAQQASMLLLDEPTSFLDIGYQVEVLDLVHYLSRDCGVGIVMSIHDLNQAMSVCDQITLLDNGRIIFDGHPHDLAHSGHIENVFGVKGRFVPLSPEAPPHFDVELSRYQGQSANHL